MIKKRLLGMPVVALAIAIAAGIVFGSLDRLRNRSIEVASENAGLEPYHEQDQIFEVAPGVTLKAARRDGEFVGYEVVGTANDERFPSGAVIVAINRMPVEDSAAGSELLVAALASGTAEVTFQALEKTE